MGIYQLREIRNVTARVTTRILFAAPRRPSIQRLGYEITAELTNCTAKAMVHVQTIAVERVANISIIRIDFHTLMRRS